LIGSNGEATITIAYDDHEGDMDGTFELLKSEYSIIQEYI
jgi:hypothetical protein